MTDTKLGLVRSDFNLHTSKTFSALFGENNFSDVTLVCEDHHQISAHKAILSSSSSFFKEIFLKSPHPNPLIYLNFKHSYVESLVRFIYLGECQVKQEDIDLFLKTARDLKVEGLASCGEEKEGKVEILNENEVEDYTSFSDMANTGDAETNDIMKNVYMDTTAYDNNYTAEMVDDPLVNTDIKTGHSQESTRLLQAAEEEHTVIEDVKDIDIEKDILQTHVDLHINPKSSTDRSRRQIDESVNKYNRVMSYAAKIKNAVFQPLHLTPREELPDLLCSFFKLARTKKMEIFNASSYTAHLYSFRRYLAEISNPSMDIMKDPDFHVVRTTVALMRERAKETEGKRAGCNTSRVLDPVHLQEAYAAGTIGPHHPDALSAAAYLALTLGLGCRSITDVTDLTNKSLVLGPLGAGAIPSWIELDPSWVPKQGMGRPGARIQPDLSSPKTCMVRALLEYQRRKTDFQLEPEKRFFWSVNDNARQNPLGQEKWFKKIEMGKHAVARLLTNALTAAGVDCVANKYGPGSARRKI